MELIDKSKVVAEIERRLKELAEFPKFSYETGLIDAYMIMRAFLETIEVKWVEEKDSFADSKKHHRASFIKELKHKVSEYEEVIKKSGDSTKCDDVDWVTLASDMFDMLQKCLLNF